MDDDEIPIFETGCFLLVSKITEKEFQTKTENSFSSFKNSYRFIPLEGIKFEIF